MINEYLKSIDITLKLYLGYKAGIVTRKQIAEYLNVDLDKIDKEKYFL